VSTVMAKLSNDIWVHGREPNDSGELAEWIDEQHRTGIRAAVRIAVHLAFARSTFFEHDPGEFSRWAGNNWGYKARWLATCVKAGRMIIDLTPVSGARCELLLDCSLDKLEALANIPRHQMPALLETWNPAEATRDQVRQKAKLFGAAGEAVTCDVCGQDFVPTDEETTCCGCAKKGPETGKQRPPADPVARLEKILLEMRETLERDPSTARRALEAGQVGVRIGVQLIVSTFDAHAHNADWAPEDWDRAIEMSRSLTAHAEEMKAAQMGESEPIDLGSEPDFDVQEGDLG